MLRVAELVVKRIIFRALQLSKNDQAVLKNNNISALYQYKRQEIPNKFVNVIVITASEI